MEEENKLIENISMDYVNHVFKIMNMDVTDLIVDYAYEALLNTLNNLGLEKIVTDKEYYDNDYCENESVTTWETILEDTEYIDEFIIILLNAVTYNNHKHNKLRSITIPHTIDKDDNSSEPLLFYWKVKGHMRGVVLGIMEDIFIIDEKSIPRDIYYVMYAAYEYKKYRDELDSNRIKPCKQ